MARNKIASIQVACIALLSVFCVYSLYVNWRSNSQLLPANFQETSSPHTIQGNLIDKLREDVRLHMEKYNLTVATQYYNEQYPRSAIEVAIKQTWIDTIQDLASRLGELSQKEPDMNSLVDILHAVSVPMLDRYRYAIEFEVRTALGGSSDKALKNEFQRLLGTPPFSQEVEDQVQSAAVAQMSASRRTQRNFAPKVSNMKLDASEILLLTGSDIDEDSEQGELLKQAMENRREYAKHHGYVCEYIDFRRYKSAKDIEHAAWYKLPAIQETFKRHPKVKWIWWLDLDAIIMNETVELREFLLEPRALAQRLESSLPLAQFDRYNWGGNSTDLSKFEKPSELQAYAESLLFLFSHDKFTLNAGSFFVKRSPETDLILDFWGDPVLMTDTVGRQRFPRREQDAFIWLMHHHRTIFDKVGVVSQALINSYPHSDDQAYQEGDFVMHLAGQSSGGHYREAWDHYYQSRTLTDKTQLKPLDSKDFYYTAI